MANEQVKKKLASLERVKARAALRVKTRFAQIEEERKLKALEQEAVQESKRPVREAKVSPVKKG